MTSPQTRVALAGRRGPSARAPRLASARLVGAERERAERIRRRQLRRAVTALLAGAGFLVGLPLVLHLAPGLDAVRLFGVPVSWLAVAVLPYPVLGGLAWWQLRRAEAAERVAADGADGGDVARGGTTRDAAPDGTARDDTTRDAAVVRRGDGARGDTASGDGARVGVDDAPRGAP